MEGAVESTKTTYRGIIERFRADHGDKGVAKMERQHVWKIIGAKAETPAAANTLPRDNLASLTTAQRTPFAPPGCTPERHQKQRNF